MQNFVHSKGVPFCTSATFHLCKILSIRKGVPLALPRQPPILNPERVSGELAVAAPHKCLSDLCEISSINCLSATGERVLHKYKAVARRRTTRFHKLILTFHDGSQSDTPSSSHPHSRRSMQAEAEDSAPRAGGPDACAKLGDGQPPAWPSDCSEMHEIKKGMQICTYECHGSHCSTVPVQSPYSPRTVPVTVPNWKTYSLQSEQRKSSK